MSNIYAEANIPTGSNNYLKLSKQAETTFRIMDDPIMGTEGWKTAPDGTRRPVRVPQGEAISVNDIDNVEELKYFWAMIVFDYAEERIKILEVTQPSVLKAIKAYARDKDFGDPKEYDFKVTKTGDGKESRYQTIAKPPKKLDSAITQLYRDMDINLQALFNGSDPFFKVDEQAKEDKLVDEVSNALKDN